ncbi:MAG: hypothetical protein ACYCXW_00850 [Solirubrobacteraceae bacterium]
MSAPSEGRSAGSRARRPLVASAAVVLVVLLLVSAAAPPAAQASGILGTGISIPNPISLIGSGISSLLGGLGGDIAKLAVGAFEAIIRALFAPIAKFITTQLIGWVITVPNLTQGRVLRLEQTVEAMGGGLLGAVATISTVRYWAAGFAGGGDSGFAALEGLARTVAAALFLASWPWLFDSGVHLTNLFTSSLMGSTAVVDQTARLLAAGLGAGVALSFTPIGLFCNIAMAVAASLLFLGLLLLKVVVSASTILVFVGMPLAAVAWPVVPWVARAAMRAFAVCLLVPVLWALCFAAGGAAMLNAISFNAPSALNALLQPLVAIVLLYVMLKLPVHLARVAMLGAAPLGGGFVSRAVSYAAGSQVRDTARQHLPSWAGGQRDTQQQPASGTAGRLRNAATLASAAASGGAAGAGAAGSGAATAGGAAGSAGVSNGRAYAPPPSVQANAAGGLQNGLQTPSFAGREQDFANEKFEAEFRARTSPVSAEQATAALASLPGGTQRGIGQLVSDHGAGAREHLAYQAMGEWSREEREALRTLAAASPDVRAQAVSDALGEVANGVDASAAGPPAGDTDGLAGGGVVTESGPREPWADGDPGGSPARSASDSVPRGVASATPSPASMPNEGRAPQSAYGESPARRLLPPAPARRSLPPPREPRGPSPDELFPKG